MYLRLSSAFSSEEKGFSHKLLDLSYPGILAATVGHPSSPFLVHLFLSGIGSIGIVIQETVMLQQHLDTYLANQVNHSKNYSKQWKINTHQLVITNGRSSVNKERKIAQLTRPNRNLAENSSNHELTSERE